MHNFGAGSMYTPNFRVLAVTVFEKNAPQNLAERKKERKNTGKYKMSVFTHRHNKLEKKICWQANLSVCIEGVHVLKNENTCMIVFKLGQPINRYWNCHLHLCCYLQ